MARGLETPRMYSPETHHLLVGGWTGATLGFGHCKKIRLVLSREGVLGREAWVSVRTAAASGEAMAVAFSPGSGNGVGVLALNVV